MAVSAVRNRCAAQRRVCTQRDVRCQARDKGSEASDGGLGATPPTNRVDPDTVGAGAPAAGRGRGPVTWAGLGALVIGSAAAVGYFQYVREREKRKVAGKVTSYGRPALGGPWELVNQRGEPVTDASYQGEYLLLYFGFTYCPDICPSELVKMGKVVSDLDGMRGLPKVRPVFISLDPNRDTVAQMAAYVQDFHPRMEALTGTPQQIARAAKHYRVYFSDVDREEDDDDYVVDHSIIMYFVAPNGDFLEFFTQLAEPDEIVEKIGFHLRQGTGTGPRDSGAEAQA